MNEDTDDDDDLGDVAEAMSPMKVTNLEVLEYGQLDVELHWPLAQLRVVEKAPGKGRSEQGDEDNDEDDDEDDDG